MTRYNQEKFKSDLRVGLVTFLGLFFIVLGVVFAGGDKGLLFRKTSFVKARLADVGGLKKGSSVTMAGMTIGRVTDIAFVDGERVNAVEVTMQIRSDVRDRVKTDSIPAVRTQGMLGDRYIDLSAGTDAAGPLAEGAPLYGEAASDFDKTLREATATLNETEKVMTSADDLIKDFKKNPRRYIKFSLF